MTFGKIKSLIEYNILESYKNEHTFKKSIREFKHYVSKDKQFSTLYALYDQLNTPQGLSESEAKDFLSEGINLIQNELKKIKIPKILSESIKNEYENIDTLVYSNEINISDRLSARKEIMNVLMSNPKKVNEAISLPIKSMVKIANQTLTTYLDNLDESTRKELLSILSEETDVLQNKFEKIKEDAIGKLTNLLENEIDSETKTKIVDTIDKIKKESFNQLNFVRLKNLESTL
jgi:predicted metal-dependent hydrolase